MNKPIFPQVGEIYKAYGDRGEFYVEIMDPEIVNGKIKIMTRTPWRTSPYGQIESGGWIEVSKLVPFRNNKKDREILNKLEAVRRARPDIRTYIYRRPSDGKVVHVNAAGHIIGKEYEHNDPNWQPPKDWPYEIVDMRIKKGKNPYRLIAGRGSLEDVASGAWVNWGASGRPLATLKKELAELNKHIGERVLLSGGGGPGASLATLRGAEIVKEGYIKGKPGLKVYLIDIDPIYRGYGPRESFDPWLDSWQISIMVPEKNPFISGLVSGMATGTGIGLAQRMLSNPYYPYIMSKPPHLWQKQQRVISMTGHSTEDIQREVQHYRWQGIPTVAIRNSRKGYWEFYSPIMRNPFWASVASGLGIGTGFAAASYGVNKFIPKIRGKMKKRKKA